MNMFIDILILFVYILTLLYFKLPDVSNNNYLFHKFYLFIGIFGFYYVYQIIKHVINNEMIEQYTILQKSIKMATYCLIGYSIYTDLTNMDWSKTFIQKFDTPNKKYIIISLVIITFITFIQMIDMLFREKSL